MQELDEEDAIALKTQKSSSQRRKQSGLAAISQQNIHNKLVEVRILLQRATQGDKTLDNDDEALGATIQHCNDLLKNLLQARDTVLRRYDRDEDDDLRTDYDELLADNVAFQRKLEEDFVECEKEWESVLNQRHKEVRLHSGLTSNSHFRVLDSTFWEQVQQSVKHEEFVQKNSQGENNTTDCFEDSKVYQQLLKDFLSSADSSKQSNDSKLQHKTLDKRRTVNSVDRRASKGRKIRYTPIPKLEKFTFPLSRQTTSHMLGEEAWFQSLFGGATGTREQSNTT